MAFDLSFAGHAQISESRNRIVLTHESVVQQFTLTDKQQFFRILVHSADRIAIRPTLLDHRLMGIGWSLHKNDGWRGQLQRVHRWHQRVIKAANEGNPDLADFTFSLFQNCYHLREWFQKTSKANPTALDLIFRQSRELQVCRDICNGTKHLTLKSASVDADFSICWEYDPAAPAKRRLVIIAGEKYDLLDLAYRCVATLDDFAATQTT